MGWRDVARRLLVIAVGGYAVPEMTLLRLLLRTGALQFCPSVPDRRSVSGSLPRAGCSRLCRVVVVWFTPKALTLLVHRTAPFVLPNVRAKGRRRWDARPGLAKMYRVPPGRAWWPAVGAPLERGVRPQCAGETGKE